MMLSWDFRQPSRGRRPMQTPQYLYVHSTTNTFVLFWIESKEVLHFSGAWIYELSVDLLHFSTNVCMCGSVACISGFHVHLWICCIHVLEIMMLFSLDLCLINCKCELSSRTFTWKPGSFHARTSSCIHVNVCVMWSVKVAVSVQIIYSYYCWIQQLLTELM